MRTPLGRSYHSIPGGNGIARVGRKRVGECGWRWGVRGVEVVEAEWAGRRIGVAG